MAYITRSEVLIEAGVLKYELGEPLDGTTDGANTTFTTRHFPIGDKNFDDDVTTSDFVVYDDGSVVSASSVTAGSGTIVLSSAPATSSVMTIDYVHHNVNESFIDMLIAQTEDWINTVMAKVETTPYTSPSATIKKIARYYSAGMLISQGYGLTSPSNDDLREGKGKIDQAEMWLSQYKAQIEMNQSQEKGVDVPQVSTDKRLFEEYSDLNGWQPLDDSDVDFNTTTSSDD